MKRALAVLLFGGIAALLALHAWPWLRSRVEPRAQVVSAGITAWGLSEVELRLDTDIANPMPVAATLGAMPCALTIGGLEMGSATFPAGTRLAARATTRISIPLRTPSVQLAALLVQGLERGAVRPYRVECKLKLALAGHAVVIPLEKRGWVDLTRHQLLREDRTPEIVMPPR